MLRATEKCRPPRARDPRTLLCTQAHPTQGKASRAASAYPLQDTRHSRSLFVTANTFIGRERRGRKTCNHLRKLQKVAKMQSKAQVPQPAPGWLWQVHLGGPDERRQLSFIPGKGWPHSLEEKQGVRGETHTALSGQDMQPVPSSGTRPCVCNQEAAWQAGRAQEGLCQLPKQGPLNPANSTAHMALQASGLQEMKGRELWASDVCPSRTGHTAKPQFFVAFWKQ